MVGLSGFHRLLLIALVQFLCILGSSISPPETCHDIERSSQLAVSAVKVVGSV